MGVLRALDAVALPMTEDSPLVLMVSGGSDSTALLVKAVAEGLDLGDGKGVRPLRTDRLHVLHVNHHIRGNEADRDERFVRDLCETLGVDVEVGNTDIPAILARAEDADAPECDRGASLEEVARHERYRLAWELACRLARERGLDVAQTRILVAHTADDRAETFVMRAMVGASLAGLTGMRARRGIVVRPLLGSSRAELRSYLTDRGVVWCDDSTNEEDAALRSYVRHHVMAAMTERAGGALASIGRTLDSLEEDDDFLERLATGLLHRALRVPQGVSLEPALGIGATSADAEGDIPFVPRQVVLDAPLLAQAEPALARRAMLKALRLALGDDLARRARIERRHIVWALELAESQGSRDLPLGTRVTCDGELLRIMPVGAQDSRGMPGDPGAGGDAQGCGTLPVPGFLRWGAKVIIADLAMVPEGADALAYGRKTRESLAAWVQAHGGSGRDCAVLDAAACGVAKSNSKLLVRGSRAGERIQPLGMGGRSKLVRDLLMEARVPADMREKVPVVHRELPAAEDDCQGVRMGVGNVVWVAGIRPDERAAYGDGAGVLLRLAFIDVAAVGAESSSPQIPAAPSC